MGTTQYNFGSSAGPMPDSVQRPDNGSIQYVKDDGGALTGVVIDGVPVQTTRRDALGRVASVEQNGVARSYRYDAAGRVTQVTTPSGTTQLSYDAAGNASPAPSTNRARRSATATTTPTARRWCTDGVGHTLQVTYDHSGRITGAIDQYGRSYAAGYDANGRRSSVVYPGGLNASWTFVASDLLDGKPPLASLVDLNGVSWSYTYDQNNALTAIVDGTGHTTSYTRADSGVVSQLTDALNRSTLFNWSGQQFSAPPAGARARRRLRLRQRRAHVELDAHRRHRRQLQLRRGEQHHHAAGRRHATVDRGRAPRRQRAAQRRGRGDRVARRRRPAQPPAARRWSAGRDRLDRARAARARRRHHAGGRELRLHLSIRRRGAPGADRGSRRRRNRVRVRPAGTGGARRPFERHAQRSFELPRASIASTAIRHFSGATLVESWSLGYDAHGRVSSLSGPDGSFQYQYDALSRLADEQQHSAGVEDAEKRRDRDAVGNLVSRSPTAAARRPSATIATTACSAERSRRCDQLLRTTAAARSPAPTGRRARPYTPTTISIAWRR